LFYKRRRFPGLVFRNRQLSKCTGLGLTLVDHILKAHKGKIKLKSKVEEVSSYRLNFLEKKNKTTEDE